MQSKSPFVQDALRSLTAGWRGYGDGVAEEMRRLYITDNPNDPAERWQLHDAGDGSNWSSSHGFLHEHVVDLQQRGGYRDVLLFDVQGNLIYSVFKEDDFALNVVDGPYAESGLGEAFRTAVALATDAEPAFVDFRAYEPGGGAPASFIAHPVFNSFDQLMGVLAFQLPSDRFNALLLNERGLGETGQTYLVGRDGILRRPARCRRIRCVEAHGRDRGRDARARR